MLLCRCTCDSLWWPLREGRATTAVDTATQLPLSNNGLLLSPLLLSKGSLRLQTPADMVVNTLLLPDPTFNKDGEV
jgi:hypothetical protein